MGNLRRKKRGQEMLACPLFDRLAFVLNKTLFRLRSFVTLAAYERHRQFVIARPKPPA